MGNSEQFRFDVTDGETFRFVAMTTITTDAAGSTIEQQVMDTRSGAVRQVQSAMVQGLNPDFDTALELATLSGELVVESCNIHDALMAV